MMIKCKYLEDTISRAFHNIKEQRNLFIALYMHHVGSSGRKFFSRCI